MPREQLRPLDGNNHPCIAVPGTGARVVTVSSPTSSSQPPVAVGGAVQLPRARVLLKFPPISKKHAVCHGAVLKPLVPHGLNGRKLGDSPVYHRIVEWVGLYGTLKLI